MDNRVVESSFCRTRSYSPSHSLCGYAPLLWADASINKVWKGSFVGRSPHNCVDFRKAFHWVLGQICLHSSAFLLDLPFFLVSQTQRLALSMASRNSFSNIFSRFAVRQSLLSIVLTLIPTNPLTPITKWRNMTSHPMFSPTSTSSLQLLFFLTSNHKFEAFDSKTWAVIFNMKSTGNSENFAHFKTFCVGSQTKFYLFILYHFCRYYFSLSSLPLR